MPLPPEIYDREYYLSQICEGYEHFRAGEVSPVRRTGIAKLGVWPGSRILDAGCGRGDALLACAQRGAAVAGIDYSSAAVGLTREALTGFPDADVRQGDVTSLPWDDATFDGALFDDVIEHIEPAQAEAAMRELRRVLKPGGRLLVHTAPNRLFLKVGWPVARPIVRALGRAEVADSVDGWISLAERYHINEQSLHGLRRDLRSAGFGRVRAWIDPNVLRSGHGYHLTQGLDQGPLLGLVARIAKTRPLRLVLGNDLYALARR